MDSGDKAKEESEIERLIVAYDLCRMFNYGFGPAGITMINNPVAGAFNTFATIHLVYTMFVVDKRGDPVGGALYKLLSPIGRGHYIKPFRTVLERPLGDTTFAGYIGNYRNKLATHGCLLPGALKECTIAVMNDRQLNADLFTWLDELRDEVYELTTKLSEDLREVGYD